MAGKIHQKLTALFFILVIPFSFVNITGLMLKNATSFPATTPHSFNPANPPLTNNKIASEEENIDSFDVNPKSGRWNVTQDATTDDVIMDSSLRLITTNNASSGTSAFDMDRGLRKTDSKFEYRVKQNSGGNQTELFRDVYGDEMDFNEGDDEGLNLEDANEVVENGIWSSESSNYFDIGRLFPNVENNFSLDIYHTIEIRIKANVSDTWSIKLSLKDVATDSFCVKDAISPTTYITTEWETYSFNFPSACSNLVYYMEIYFGSNDGIGKKFWLDYLKILGDLDYSTHIEGSREETIDFEDSFDYFNFEESNISDFDDGTTENWTSTTFDTVANSNGMLNVSGIVVNAGIQRTALSITASTYKWLTFEFQGTRNITNFVIGDGAGNIVCTDSTGWISNTFHLFSCDLSLNANWTGTETGIQINTTFDGAGSNLYLNFTFLYNVELGDLEDYSGFNYEYVNPAGYITGKPVSASSDSLIESTVNIDASLFDYFTIYLKGESDTNVELYRQTTTDASWKAIGSKTSLTGTWQTLNINASADSDWSGTIDQIRLTFDQDTGNLDGNEYFFIDYILITGHWASTDSVIGLMDPSDKSPLLNLTTHFFDQPNDPNYPTSVSLRYEIELLDESGDLSYYYYSSNYTAYVGAWTRWKVSYNVLQSELTVDIKDDNDDRIVKIEFPDDFTSASARGPALFSLGYSPALFLSTYSVPISWQEIQIDYLSAPFQERTWQSLYSPSDADWITNAWDTTNINGAVGTADNATWRLTVPYLDSVTGQLYANFSNCLGCIGNANISAQFRIYAVDSNDGELHELIEVFLGYGWIVPPDVGYEVFALRDGSNFGNVLESYEDAIPGTGDQNPYYLDFSISITDLRQQMQVKALGKRTGLDRPFDLSYTKAISDVVDTNQESQEFVVEVVYYGHYGDAENVDLQLRQFGLIERDIFGDIVGIIVDDVISGGGIFEWLAGIFITLTRFIVNAILNGLLGLLLSLYLVIQLMNTTLSNMYSTITAMASTLSILYTYISVTLAGFVDGLETLLSVINTVLDNVLLALADVTFLSDLWSVIESIVSDLSAAIWTAIIPEVSTILDTIAALMNEFFADILTDIIPSFESLWDIFWTAIFNVVDPTGNLKTTIDNWVAFIDDFFSNIFTLLSWIGSIAPWIMIGILFFIFTLPFLMNQDEYTGRVNFPKAAGGVVKNAFIGIRSPDVSALGFKAVITVPLVVIVYIILKIMIGDGTFPDIFEFLPI